MAPPAKLMQVLALGLVVVLSLFWLLPSSSAPSSLAAARGSSTGSHTGPPSLTADDISLLYESRRLAKLADYDAAADEAEFRFRDLGETLPAYVARLRSFVFEAFPAHLQPPLLESIARLEHQLPPDPDRPPISRKIYTTNKSKFDLPPSFAEWKTMQPDWAVDVLDDDGMEDWIDQYFGKGGAAHEMGPVWRALPKIVLKSDSLRYVLAASAPAVIANPARVHPLTAVTPRPRCAQVPHHAARGRRLLRLGHDARRAGRRLGPRLRRPPPAGPAAQAARAPALWPRRPRVGPASRRAAGGGPRDVAQAPDHGPDHLGRRRR